MTAVVLALEADGHVQVTVTVKGALPRVTCALATAVFGAKFYVDVEMLETIQVDKVAVPVI